MLTVYPNAWMESFGIESEREKQVVNKQIVAQVEAAEQSYRIIRDKEGKRVMGARALVLQPMDTPYEPNRSGRRMWCICHDIELRKAYLRLAKDLVEQAYKVYQRWKLGDLTVPYPPSMPKLAEPIEPFAINY